MSDSQMTIKKEQYRILGRTGLQVSPIGLGTAEIGFAYGIGPRELPSESEADYILKLAVDLGINYFDAARAYQFSEERIGKSGIANMNGVIISTKCAQFLETGEELSSQDKEKRMTDEVETSLRNLKVDALPLLYLHGGTKTDIENGIVIEVLQKLKKAGKVRFLGISLRGEENALAAIKSGFFDVIQLAHSILDQRMVESVLPLAMEKKIGVVNRSVLLKGALTPLRVHLPDELKLLKDNAQSAQKIASDLGIDLPSLAIRFALSNSAIATVLVGTNKPEHLIAAVETAKLEPLSGDVLEKLRTLAISDACQVDPKEWPASAGGHPKK